jgi:hypothetical protein
MPKRQHQFQPNRCSAILPESSAGRHCSVAAVPNDKQGPECKLARSIVAASQVVIWRGEEQLSVKPYIISNEFSFRRIEVPLYKP